MTTSSSSSSISYGWSYDVFLSFRGQDTRYGFTGNLYKALCYRGIRTFIDDRELHGGEAITPTLMKAIEESRIAIIVLSKNYASSSFCLDELTEILDYFPKNRRLVLPVFYDVDPSLVRHHTKGSYGEALAKHKERSEGNKDKMERLEKWKMALKQVADLSGSHFKYGNEYEHEFIGKIVNRVSSSVSRVPLHVADYPVGLESHVLQVNSLLEVGSNDGVEMVGIYGIGGIGKTTLALAVYNSIFDYFEGSCFLRSVRENSNNHGLLNLQKTVLSKILGDERIELSSINEGISILQHRLKQKKVLLILDDVDNQTQLDAIAGKREWFGPCSRVIITTRNIQLLKFHKVEKTYEVKGLNQVEAFELLSWKAFNTDKVDPCYEHILNRAYIYASGHPLALELLGSNLFGKSTEEWESALDGYEMIPDKEIQEILKVSFDALQVYEQEIFLDIACFFKGYSIEEVEKTLFAHYGGKLKHAIGVLVDRCLIKVDSFKVTLHDLIEAMGKAIVQQESLDDPEKRSRLWFHEDIIQVLKENKGTSKTQIIILDFPMFGEEGQKVVKWKGAAFKKMEKLKILIIKNVCFSKGPKYLPNSLRVLEWWGYPSECLPSDFHPENLAILKLPNCLKSLKLPKKQKVLLNVKVLKLDHCKWIKQIPNVSGLSNLEELSFEYCENLKVIDKSVGFLGKLKVLNASGCAKLRSFPPLKLASLKDLCLSGCCCLETFPEILGEMNCISVLNLLGTSIKELPSSIVNLKWLNLFFVPNLGVVRSLSGLALAEMHEIEVGTHYRGMSALPWTRVFSNKVVVECGYSICEVFPFFLEYFTNNVTGLGLSFHNFTVLPRYITECCPLNFLHLDYCPYLEEIGGLPPNLKSLLLVDCTSLSNSCRRMLLSQETHEEAGSMSWMFPGCQIPEWFEYRRQENPISFWFRGKFPGISLCYITRNGYMYGHRFNVCINGVLVGHIGFGCIRWVDKTTEVDHIQIFDVKPIQWKDNSRLEYRWNNVCISQVTEVTLENEWNHVVISPDVRWILQNAPQYGLHVFKEKNSLEDVRFTNPNERDVDRDSNSMVSTDGSAKMFEAGALDSNGATNKALDSVSDACDAIMLMEIVTTAPIAASSPCADHDHHTILDTASSVCTDRDHRTSTTVPRIFFEPPSRDNLARPKSGPIPASRVFFELPMTRDHRAIHGFFSLPKP